MKRLLSLILVASAGFLFTGYISHSVRPAGESLKSIEIPDDAMAVIKNSCYGCHNSESSNEDAKKDLSFDTFDSLKPFELAAALEDIKDEIEKDKMPPAKFLKKNPDKALKKADKKILLKWVGEEMEKLESK